MKVVVTGGSGRLGSYVVRALIECGHEVTSVDRVHPKTGGIDQILEGFTRITADIMDLGNVYDVLKGHDAVIHLAALIDPRFFSTGDVFRTNVISTFNVLQAAWQFGIKKVVIASTATILGTQFAYKDFDPIYFPIDEEHPIQPQDCYALSKLVGEEIAKSFVRRGDITVTALRFAWIQTPESYSTNLLPIIERPELNRTNFWTYVDVRDAAQACRLAMEKNINGFNAFYICAEDTFMNIPTVELLKRYYPSVPLKRPLEDYESPISIGKAKQYLNYKPKFSAKQFLKI
ncbi:MAG: NAD(P)-dependent oxidoreductase [Nitrososphaeria archaeon]